MAKKPDKVMVCVTRQKTCERLINYGSKVAKEKGVELVIVHAVKSGDNFLGNPHEGEALEYLFDISQKAGAELTLLRDEDVEKALTEFAKNKGVRLIVMGQTPQQGETIITRLQKRLPQIEFMIVTAYEGS